MNKKSKKPTEQELAKAKLNAAVFAKIDELLNQTKLSTTERNDLYAISGHMADDEVTSEDFLLMYLSKDRDWKKDFKTVFGREAGKLTPNKKKKYDITKVTRAVVKKKK